MVLKEEKLLSSVADRKCKRSLIFPQWPLPRTIYRRNSGTTPGAIPPLLSIIASVCTYDAHPRIPCSDNCSAQESLDTALQSIASEKRAIQSLEPERIILEFTCIPIAVADQLLTAACDGFSFVHFHLAYRLSEPLVVDCFPASRQPVVRPGTSFATMHSMEEICRFLILSEKID